MNQKSSDTLRQAAAGTKLAKRDVAIEFRSLLEKNKGAITAALPKHMTPDRMLRISLTAFNMNKDLLDCDPRTVLACIVMGAQLGLEIGVQGQAYLIPYKGNCTFVPGWRGLQDLVNRSGRATTWTQAVFEGDEFEYLFGTSPSIRHIPKEMHFEPEKMTHAYAVGRVRGAEWPIMEVWPSLKVTRHRDRFNKVGARHYSFQHYIQYARKVALMQVFKYVPMSIEMQVASSLDLMAERENQQLKLDEVLHGGLLASPIVSEQDQRTDDPATDEKDERTPEMTTTGQQSSLIQITEADAIAMVKAAGASETLNEIWFKQIVPAFESMPVNVEAAKHDRLEFLKALEAKKRGED